MTCFRLLWPLAKAADLLEAWQSWAPSAPDELAASLLLNLPADPERPPTAALFGSSLGARTRPSACSTSWSSAQERIRHPPRSSTCSTRRPSATSGSTLPAPSRRPRVQPATRRRPPSRSASPSSSDASSLGRRSPRSSTTSRPGELPVRHASSTSLPGVAPTPGPSRRRPLSPPPGALSPQACGQPRHRRLDRAARRRPHLAHAIAGARPSLGLRRRISQLRRPRTDRPCDRVLRRQSQPLVRIKAEYDADNFFRSPTHETPARLEVK